MHHPMLRSFAFLVVLLVPLKMHHHGASLAAAAAAVDCGSIQADIDDLSSTDAVLRYLRSGMPSEQYASDLFGCMAPNVQALPTRYIASDGSDREYIYGSGSVVVYTDGSFVRGRIGLRIYRQFWKGKVFRTIPTTDDVLQLYNILPLRRNVDFPAIVYLGPSVHDGTNGTILLDYRNNLTSTLDIRDELRDIQWRGEPSRIYLGRLYRFNGTAEDILTSAWDELTNFRYIMNFLLDIRSEAQSSLPRWAERSPELN